MDDTTKRDDFRKMMRAYAGFQMATALIVSAKAGDVCWAWIVLSLFAVSIPSTYAYSIVAHITEQDMQRYPARISHIAGFLTYIPSGAALALLIGVASAFAGVLFAVTGLIWGVVIVGTVWANARKKKQP
jgi:predicted membrane channel-forming protein YqfA (hemolysin III family)